MPDEPLARIPFRAEDELTIVSMARWMRFIAVVTIIGGLLTLFAVLVAIVYASVTPIPVTVRLGRGRDIVDIHRGYLLVGAVVALAMASVNIYIGSVLYEAGDDFDRMARTDAADQAYLARGLDRLKRYFQVFVVVAALTFLAGLAIALSFVARASAA